MTKVSVVVPVYNPGDHIDDCIRSLLGQTLPAGELELIFVDDGSTDATPARLDALAAQHAHVRVAHIPNSGWPGRPRNVGLDLARGDYVYFVDNDDWLGSEALSRLYEMAREDDADVVIGKVVGHGRRVSQRLFRRSLRGVPFDSPLLLALLTPHKLFRRSLLAGIRFPEGRRRLEDHVFVVEAYFAARRISVLADYPCYHWVLRDEQTSASAARFDAEAYFDDVREVLDVVSRHTSAGDFRDSLLLHWYRGKALARVGGSGWPRRPDAYRRELHAAVRRLVLERFDERLDAALPFHLRVRAWLLRSGAYEDLVALAELEAGLRARVRGGMRLRGQLRPLRYGRRGERVLWEPPERLRAALAGFDLDATEGVARARIEPYLHRRSDGAEYPLEARGGVRLRRGRPVVDATVDLDPATAAAGTPLPAGEWELRASVTVAGFSHARRVRRRGRPVVLRAPEPGRIARG